MEKEKYSLRNGFKKARKRKGISQAIVAEKMDVTLKTVMNWEQGVSNPDFATIVKLAELFDCDLDSLAGRINERTHDIKTVCEITGLSEKAVEKITPVKPHRDTNGLLPTIDYDETTGKLTKEGIEKQKRKKPHYSIIIPPLSRLIESERFSSFLFAYRTFLDSAEKLSHSLLEPIQQRTNDDGMIVLNHEEATKHYMRNVSEMITRICQDEIDKSMAVASEKTKKMYERMMEEDPDEDREDE